MKAKAWFPVALGFLLFFFIACVGCGDDDDDDPVDDDARDDDAVDDDTTDDDIGNDDTDDDDTGDDDTTDDDTSSCDGCLIDSVCYADGDVNLLNGCLYCDVAHSTTEWSYNDGAACDDEVFCNGTDQCLFGVCDYHAGDPCGDDGNWCNGVESCNEDQGECISQYDAGNPRCPDDGLFCNGDESCDETDDRCVSSGDPCEFPEVCEEGDDQCVPACFRDADFDGYGDVGIYIPLVTTCPPGWVENGEDCEDADAISFPGAPELPDDGIDQNCDGVDFIMSDDTGIFVAPTGNDDNPGAMAEPKATLYAGRQAAYEQDKVVFVAAGTYAEPAAAHVSFFGGYEPENWTRDIAANETIIAPEYYSGFSVNYAGPAVAIQGFTIVNNNPIACATYAVYVAEEFYATVADNLMQPIASNSNGSFGVMVYGEAKFVDNIIMGSDANDLAFGAYVRDNGSAYFEGNTIVAGDSDLYSRGIDTYNGGTVIAVGNEIAAGTATDISSGVMAWTGSQAILINNFLDAGFADLTNAVYGYGGEITAINNVIYGGEATARAYGVTFYDQAHGLIVNNIIDGGNGDIYSIGVRASEGRVMLYNNDIYGDTTTYLVNSINSLDDINNCEFTGCTEAGGNISEDPLLDVDRLHLTGDSPCIDAGIDPTFWYGGFGALWDFDGDTRPQGEGWDIGADEVVP